MLKNVDRQVFVEESMLNCTKSRERKTSVKRVRMRKVLTKVVKHTQLTCESNKIATPCKKWREE